MRVGFREKACGMRSCVGPITIAEP